MDWRAENIKEIVFILPGVLITQQLGGNRCPY